MTRTSVRKRARALAYQKRIAVVLAVMTTQVELLHTYQFQLVLFALLLGYRHYHQEAIAMVLTYDPANRVKSLDRAFERWNDGECMAIFRFNKQGLRKLYSVLEFSDDGGDKIRVPMGHNGMGFTFYKSELLLVTLAALAYPCRWVNLMERFGLSEPQISKCVNYTVKRLKFKYSPLLTNIEIWRDRFPLYASAVNRLCGPTSMQNCWGFIDGTVRPISRPSKNKRARSGRRLDVQRYAHTAALRAA
jgi:hypothetical protein